MKLYIVRHAHAVSEEEDGARPLSAKGRETAAATARWVRRHAAPDVTELWHSTLARSRETAEVFLDGLRLKARLREVPGLLPEVSPETMATALGRHNASLMIVGHEPQLSSLTALLLGMTDGTVDLKKGAVVALERKIRGGPWALLWSVSPQLVVGDE